MTPAEFHAIFHERWSQSEKVLAAKGKEYASEETHDRLHNFKEAAKLMRCTPLEACLGFMTKHIISIVDLVKKPPEIPSKKSFDMIDEKIGDAINYLILMEALWKEGHMDLLADPLLTGAAVLQKITPPETDSER